jgi:hypothetical protein
LDLRQAQASAEDGFDVTVLARPLARFVRCRAACRSGRWFRRQREAQLAHLFPEVLAAGPELLGGLSDLPGMPLERSVVQHVRVLAGLSA